MYAVVATFEMDRPNAQQVQFLRDGIVARVSREPGFVAGYWTHDGTHNHNMLVFDSLEAAELRAADVRGNTRTRKPPGSGSSRSRSPRSLPTLLRRSGEQPTEFRPLDR